MAAPDFRDDSTREFLDGLARGELLLRECLECGTYSEPLALACCNCKAAHLRWSPVSPEAKVISWAVAHNRPPGGVTEQVTLVIAELTAGPWLWSRLVGPDSGHVTVGSPLLVERAKHASGFIPVFRLAVSAGSYRGTAQRLAVCDMAEEY